MKLYSLLCKARDLWDQGYSRHICDCLYEAEVTLGQHPDLDPIFDFIHDNLGGAFNVERWLAHVYHRFNIDTMSAQDLPRYLAIVESPEFSERCSDYREFLWDKIFETWGQK